jgi:hypothetical protein
MAMCASCVMLLMMFHCQKWEDEEAMLSEHFMSNQTVD